jgi:hypothetical protein
MPSWRSRSPDLFPAYFLQAVERCVETVLIDGAEAQTIMQKELTIDQAVRMAKQFRYFRWCIREHPMHKLFNIEGDYALAVRTIPLDHKFALRLVVKRKVKAADLQKALDAEVVAPFA